MAILSLLHALGAGILRRSTATTHWQEAEVRHSCDVIVASHMTSVTMLVELALTCMYVYKRTCM